MNEQDRKDLVSFRLKRARETYNEVLLHVESELWNTAVNRLYYACFYAVTALLISKEIKTISHAGTRLMFGLHFVKPGLIDKQLGKFYSDIFDLRQSGDYEDFIEFTKEDLTDLLQPAEDLINQIEKLMP